MDDETSDKLEFVDAQAVTHTGRGSPQVTEQYFMPQDEVVVPDSVEWRGQGGLTEQPGKLTPPQEE